MPTSQHCEETYPLLLLFLDDETARGRRVQIDKGRYQGITTGASTVITQWPSKFFKDYIFTQICQIDLQIICHHAGL